MLLLAEQLVDHYISGRGLGSKGAFTILQSACVLNRQAALLAAYVTESALFKCALCCNGPACAEQGFEIVTVRMLESDTMTVQSAQAELISVLLWIDERFSGIDLPADPRVRIASGCLDIALEHQAAIALLVKNEMLGSAFALMRVIVESVVRGMWFARCATGEELDKFQKDKLEPSFSLLVKALERGTGSNTLSRMHETSWNALCGFTHTGFHQIRRRNSEDTTAPDYPEAEVIQVLNFAASMGLIAAVELATLAGNEPLMQEALERSRQHVRKSGGVQHGM
jgi:hypothetical protein